MSPEPDPRGSGHEEARRAVVAVARTVGILLCIGFLALARHGRPAVADDQPLLFLGLLAAALALAIACAVVLFRAVRRDWQSWRR